MSHGARVRPVRVLVEKITPSYFQATAFEDGEQSGVSRGNSKDKVIARLKRRMEEEHPNALFEWNVQDMMSEAETEEPNDGG